MPILSDTTPEAEQVLRDVLRRMPFDRKWRQMGVLHATGRRLHVANVLSRFPEAGPDELLKDWARQAGHALPPSLARWSVMIDNQDSVLAVLHVAGALDRLGIGYALGGSWASSLLGKLRFTHDADFCVEPFAGKEQAFCDSLGEDYYVSLAAVGQAIRTRRCFNVINTLTSFKLDLFINKPRPFDQSLMQRRRSHSLGPNVTVQLVTPEDVILLKLEWYRLGGEASGQQLADVRGVLEVQGTALDQTYLRLWAETLGVRDLLDRMKGEAGLS